MKPYDKDTDKYLAEAIERGAVIFIILMILILIGYLSLIALNG